MCGVDFVLVGYMGVMCIEIFCIEVILIVGMCLWIVSFELVFFVLRIGFFLLIYFICVVIIDWDDLFVFFYVDIVE